MRRIAQTSVKPAVLALGWLAGLGVVLAGLASTWLPVLRPEQYGAIALAQAEEGSTPDCEMGPPDPDPAGQRRRHLDRLGVDRWHAAGHRGRGVKIAILDSGFRGYREFLGKGLPDYVVARSFRRDGALEARNSQHGVLCAEAIHTLAPDADILLANWEPDSPDRFLDAVRWAKNQGARVLSCSLIMPSWSDVEGGGPVHAALARIVGTGGDGQDVLFFASAGNMARRHWTGAFHDRGTGLYEWEPGVTDNPLVPWGNERVSVEVCWQPGDSFELQVIDEISGVPVVNALRRNSSRSCAVVRFLPERAHLYSVRVRRAQAEGNGHFHLVTLGGELRYATPWGSIPFPGDGKEVLAVGAVNADGLRYSYSSCGANPRRPKPDLVAPVPFPSMCRARPFAGTSAAAPQAAALAALWWGRHPDWTAAQVRQAMQSTARDLGPPGPDCETGFGLVALPPRDLTLSVSHYHPSPRAWAPSGEEQNPRWRVGLATGM